MGSFRTEKVSTFVPLSKLCIFVSGVAMLPRVVILTMHDISMKRASASQGRSGDSEGRLILEGVVKTYRYVDEDEQAQRAAEQTP